MVHTLCFSLQNAVYFMMLPFLVPVLFTFYIQSVLKFKCKTPVPKGYRKERMLEIERGGTRPHCAENWLWNGLWTCRQADCVVMNTYCENPGIYLDNSLTTSEVFPANFNVLYLIGMRHVVVTVRGLDRTPCGIFVHYGTRG